MVGRVAAGFFALAGLLLADFEVCGFSCSLGAATGDGGGESVCSEAKAEAVGTEADVEAPSFCPMPRRWLLQIYDGGEVRDSPVQAAVIQYITA